MMQEYLADRRRQMANCCCICGSEMAEGNQVCKACVDKCQTALCEKAKRDNSGGSRFCAFDPLEQLTLCTAISQQETAWMGAVAYKSWKNLLSELKSAMRAKGEASE